MGRGKKEPKAPSAGPDMLSDFAAEVNAKIHKRKRPGKLKVIPRSGVKHRLSVDTDKNYYQVIREYAEDNGLSLHALIHKALAREIGSRLATRRWNPIVNLKVKERE